MRFVYSTMQCSSHVVLGLSALYLIVKYNQHVYILTHNGKLLKRIFSFLIIIITSALYGSFSHSKSHNVITTHIILFGTVLN